MGNMKTRLLCLQVFVRRDLPNGAETPVGRKTANREKNV